MINALLSASAKTYFIAGIVLFLLSLFISFLSIAVAMVGLVNPTIFGSEQRQL